MRAEFVSVGVVYPSWFDSVACSFFDELGVRSEWDEAEVLAFGFVGGGKAPLMGFFSDVCFGVVADGKSEHRQEFGWDGAEEVALVFGGGAAFGDSGVV